MTAAQVIAELRAKANPANVAGMSRFGISSQGTLGVSVVEIRALARRAGRSHELALELWDSGIHEARILATIVDDPKQLTRRQMDAWARDFDSWDVCDQACQNLFWRAERPWEVAAKWSKARAEFVRRAGFALMASMARTRTGIPDERLEEMLPLIVAASTDERNYVRKAVNWALRGIGKRNERLLPLAIATAREIRELDSKAARWIASDALRELEGR